MGMAICPQCGAYQIRCETCAALRASLTRAEEAEKQEFAWRGTVIKSEERAEEAERKKVECDATIKRLHDELIKVSGDCEALERHIATIGDTTDAKDAIRLLCQAGRVDYDRAEEAEGKLCRAREVLRDIANEGEDKGADMASAAEYFLKVYQETPCRHESELKDAEDRAHRWKQSAEYTGELIVKAESALDDLRGRLDEEEVANIMSDTFPHATSIVAFRNCARAVIAHLRGGTP
jgi:hypothetical protein